MKFFILGLLAVAFVPFANAQLVIYNFAGAPGDQVSQAASSAAANVTASAIIRGSGLTASAAGDSMSSTGFTTGSSVDLDDYYSFTLTAAEGYTLDLGTLAFAERRSGTGIRGFSIRTSLDSFGSDVFSVSVPDNTSTRDQSFTFGSSFDSLTSITIRIYGYSSEAAGGTWRLANSSLTSNMSLTGTVTAVPEPATAVTMLFGMGAMVWTIRRRRSV